MTPKEKAYEIIETEAEMIKSGRRPFFVTIHWLEEAVRLLALAESELRAEGVIE